LKLGKGAINLLGNIFLEIREYMYNTEKSSLVYKSRWLQVYEDSVIYNDNNNDKNSKIISSSSSRHPIKMFNRIKVDDTVIIIPILEDGSLLMVEGYRHGAGENLLEFPGGFIEKNEEPSQAAKRELFEETKHSCDSLEIMNWFYTWPGRTAQKNYVFVAKGLKNNNDLFLGNGNNNDVQSDRDDEMDIKIHKLPIGQITVELKSGRRIKSSPTISALFLVKEIQMI
jgi:8-oxo-dGTP pyrophosphatase MutT (NUDIX family)